MQQSRRQSCKKKLSLKKTKLVLYSLKVYYFNLDLNNTMLYQGMQGLI